MNRLFVAVDQTVAMVRKVGDHVFDGCLFIDEMSNQMLITQVSAWLEVSSNRCLHVR